MMPCGNEPHRSQPLMNIARNAIDLQAFHDVSRNVDFRSAVVALLDEFRRGAIADRDRTHEAHAIATHLRSLTDAWDAVFPKFPDCPWKRRTIRWEYHRGRRDAYLKQLVISLVPDHAADRRLIVNPATVFGRHARALAKALPGFDVLGTDIDATWNRLYQLVGFWRYHNVTNYRFARENIFAADVQRRPLATCFWGACGPVTDGIMDYAIATDSPFLVCRSCCHDNIGGNTRIVHRPGLLNAFFAWKNALYLQTQKKQTGYYFCARYTEDAYPRSRVARELMDTRTIIAVAQNSVDSDICRSLIDLDRCLYLREHGYDVLYREELFVAHKRS